MNNPPTSTPTEVAVACAAAAAAAPGWAALDRSARADALRQAAAELEAVADEVVATADEETSLGEPRLRGELARTCFQLRFLADVAVEGSYLEATVDHADESPMGPRPDLRRMLVPVGPVAVFGASNFPLAFSVPGGDTAAALAVGCPVVVKAHEAHPRTSDLCFEALRRALPDGVIGVVHGREAGVALVQDRCIRAVAFTGSTAGGRVLADLAASRPEPIPFYGELGGVNPFVVTPRAAAARGEAIGRGLADSFTLGAGQFCTKPGLAFVPQGGDGDRLRDALTEAARGRELTMLTDGIRRAFQAATGASSDEPAVRPSVVEVDVTDLAARGDLLEEVFGPYVVLVRYTDTDALLDTLGSLPGSLAATVHAEDDDPLAAALAETLLGRSGRLVWNGYPTGVAVGWAQQHGGPWPGTNTFHTSVGATSVRRFLRPVAWQSAPAALLPPELRDADDVVVPTRLDGVLHLPSAAASKPSSSEKE